MTTIIAASVIASFIIAAAIGPALIRYLHNMNFGQKILSYVPEHAGKQNTGRPWAALCSSSALRL